MKRLTGNRKFCKTIKLNFTEMTLKDERTSLVDGDVIKEEKNSKIILKKLYRLLKLNVPYYLI